MDLVTIYLNIDRKISGNAINSWANSILEISTPKLDDFFSNNRSKLLFYLGEYNPSFIERKSKYEIEIVVEEGSLKTWITISLAIFIGYGGIRQSIDYAIKDSNEISKLVTDTVISGKNINREEIIKRRTTIEDPQKLLNLFKQVENGKLSPPEATEKAIEILQIKRDEPTIDIIATYNMVSQEFLEAQKLSNTKKLSHHDIPTIPLERFEKVTNKIEAMSPREKKRKGVKIKWNSIDKRTVTKEYYK